MTALLFPGQGSQQAGMGAALAAASPAAREVFAEADAILGFALSDVCFAGSDDDLRPTEIAQPALLTAAYAAWRACGDPLAEPALTAGHSLGEYTALVVAGVFDFACGLRLVRRRGELMRAAAAATPGAMAALLKLDDATVERLCAEAEGLVAPANFNAPGQVVISGEQAAVEAVCEAARAAGGRGQMLNVSGAFHSPAMAPAAEAMANELAGVEFQPARCPVVPNVSAEPTTDPDVLRANLTAQITGPVRWTATIARLRTAGVGRCVELGPGAVLAGLVKRCDRELPCRSVGDPAGVDGLAAWLASEVAGV